MKWLNGLLPIQDVPITTVGVNVLINSPNRKFYVALTPIASHDADQQTAGAPIEGSAAIRRAFEHHDPLVDVTLGSGTHG